MKPCRKCEIVKPLDQFHKHPGGQDGLRERCKACIKEYQQVWRAANLDVIKAKAKARRQTPEFKARKKELNRRAQENYRKRIGDAAYREMNRRKAVEARLRKAYGLTLADLDRMLEEQNHVCRICKRALTPTYRNVDHDHQTGRIRGLLCSRCNTGLGNFKDNAQVIEAAIRYVAQQKGVPCDICGTDLSETKHYMRHIDHCHDTGRVRGLLCERCNRGLGQFEDDPERMNRAMEYLTK